MHSGFRLVHQNLHHSMFREVQAMSGFTALYSPKHELL
jgi:hypothetical protein